MLITSGVFYRLCDRTQRKYLPSYRLPMHELDANSAFVIVGTAKASLMKERGLCISSPLNLSLL